MAGDERRMASARHDEYARQILDVVEVAPHVSQRTLARELGIALGLTNLLLKRLVRKGWVRVTHIQPNRVRYLITPRGIAEKARMSREYLDASLQFYRYTRDRVRGRFIDLSQQWPAGERDKRIVFYSAGEVAEIGYVCLAETDLRLLGVIDAEVRGEFFGLPVCAPTALNGMTFDGQPFARLVVMSFDRPEDLKARTAQLPVPPDRVFFL